MTTITHSLKVDINTYIRSGYQVPIKLSYKMGLEGLYDSYFKSFYTTPFIGLLTSFASCVFVVGLIWRIFLNGD